MNLSKVCSHCGRTFSWRKKWEHCWDEVKYCSASCRKSADSNLAVRAERSILDSLKVMPAGTPLNPDAVARQLEPDQTSRHWQHAVREVMHAARRLSRQNQIQITRKGKAVDPDDVRGVVRLRLK